MILRGRSKLASTKNTEELVISLARAAESKKAEDIVILKIGELLRVCDYFLIITSTSSPQADTLVETIREEAKKRKIKVFKSSISRSNDWILLDLGDIVVHIFSEEGRKYYQLDRLWKDAPALKVG